MRKIAAVIFLATALTACGNKAALQPKAGPNLPPPPYGREEPLSAEALLEPSQQSVLERSVELRRRSEEREDNPFDLPPPE